MFSFKDEIKPEMLNSADKQRKNDKDGKKYFYYVYSGNFPHHIENALKKRGVWKQFDKSAQETKFQLRNFNALSPPKIKKYLATSTKSQSLNYARTWR